MLRELVVEKNKKQMKMLNVGKWNAQIAISDIFFQLEAGKITPNQDEQNVWK